MSTETTLPTRNSSRPINSTARSDVDSYSPSASASSSSVKLATILTFSPVLGVDTSPGDTWANTSVESRRSISTTSTCVGFSIVVDRTHQQVAHAHLALPQPSRPARSTVSGATGRPRSSSGTGSGGTAIGAVRASDSHTATSFACDTSTSASSSIAARIVGHLRAVNVWGPRVGDHARHRPGCRPTSFGNTSCSRIDVGQHRLEPGCVDDLGALDGDRQHLFDDATNPSMSVASNDSSSGRRCSPNPAVDVGVHRHGDDAAALTLGQQRHHHDRGELTGFVGDGEQRVGCRRETRRAAVVSTPTASPSCEFDKRDDADDEHRRRSSDEQHRHHRPDDGAPRSTLSDRRHAGAP